MLRCLCVEGFYVRNKSKLLFYMVKTIYYITDMSQIWVLMNTSIRNLNKNLWMGDQLVGKTIRRIRKVWKVKVVLKACAEVTHL